MDAPNKDWHLDRRLQITHILSTLAMGVGAIMYVGDIRKDVEVLKSQKVEQVLQDQRQDAAMVEIKRETSVQLDKIDQKLDRLIERRTK